MLQVQCSDDAAMRRSIVSGKMCWREREESWGYGGEHPIPDTTCARPHEPRALPVELLARAERCEGLRATLCTAPEPQRHFFHNPAPVALSPSVGCELQSLASKLSPTRAQAHAGKTIRPTTTAPRPIDLQHTAAQLTHSATFRQWRLSQTKFSKPSPAEYARQNENW